MRDDPRQPGTIEYLTAADLSRELNERVKSYFGAVPPPPSPDRAHLALYRRDEAYYLLMYNLVVNGLWVQQRGREAVVIDRTVSAGALGGIVFDALRPAAWVDPDPMAARRPQPKPAVLHQAKVRSWREFARPALFVGVSREETLYTVHPHVRDVRRLDDTYIAAPDGHARLSMPDETAVGDAVLRAFRILANSN